jgi:spermidine/putrescine transport system permease protein
LSSGFGQVGLIVSTCAKAMLVVGISAVISYPIAYYIVFRLRSASAAGTILLLVALPFLVGPLIRTIAWSGILGVQGVANWGLTASGITSEPVGWLLFSNFAVIVSLVYNTYPFMLFTLVLSLETLDPHLASAARDLGAGALRAFTHVLLPLSAPGLLIGSMLTFIPAVGASLEPELLGGPNGRFISNSISDVFFLALNWPLGSAVAVIFGLAALASWSIMAAVVFLVFRGSFTLGRA